MKNRLWLGLECTLLLSVVVTTSGQVVLLDSAAGFDLGGQNLNGIQYGYYDTAGYTGSFTSAGMTANPATGRWEGPFADAVTPVFTASSTHEGTDNSGHVTNAAVRRFTNGTAGHPGYTGPVEIEFQAWKTAWGSVGNGADIFITLNGMNLFSARIPNGSTQNAPFLSSSLMVTLNAGDTVDFGVTDLTGDSVSDVVGFTATITTVPEPSACGAMLGFGALAAVWCRRCSLRAHSGRMRPKTA